MVDEILKPHVELARTQFSLAVEKAFMMLGAIEPFGDGFTAHTHRPPGESLVGWWKLRRDARAGLRHWYTVALREAVKQPG